MKKAVITTVIVLLLILAAPATLLIAGFCTPARFDETYYGELSHVFASRADGREKDSDRG